MAAVQGCVWRLGHPEPFPFRMHLYYFLWLFSIVWLNYILDTQDLCFRKQLVSGMTRWGHIALHNMQAYFRWKYDTQLKPTYTCKLKERLYQQDVCGKNRKEEMNESPALSRLCGWLCVPENSFTAPTFLMSLGLDHMTLNAFSCCSCVGCNLQQSSPA